MASNTGVPYWKMKSANPVGKYMNQLQFNLEAAPKAFNLETHFEKPKPILIEKLDPVKTETTGIGRNYPISLTRSSSSLSSDCLDLAVQLAKRDVKKLKNMLVDPQLSISGIIGNSSDGNQGNELEMHKKGIDVKKAAKISVIDKQKRNEIRNGELKPHLGKLVKTVEAQERRKVQNEDVQFYDSDGGALEDDEKLKSPIPKIKEMSEIKRLRRELQKYMKRLDSVLEQKDIESKDADHIKRKTHFEEETEYERKEHRAEEQSARSARVLYMLQRKIQEIQDELEKKGHHIRHTKKSQSLTRLAAAHRAAVRALQMFVNQAPLYYDLRHGLPPMYNELALLIQQLSLLSSQYDSEKDLPDFDLDMLPRTKKLISSWNQKNKPQPKREVKKSQKKSILQRKHQPVEVKHDFLHQLDQLTREKPNAAGKQGRDILDISSKTNEPTPEREAALQAGINALGRARESSSFVSQGVAKKDGGLRWNKAGKAKSKLANIPRHIKHNRHWSLRIGRAHPSRSRRTGGQEMGFAKQTVSSTLKQQPEVVYKPKRVMAVSPNRSEIPEGVHVTYGTPKQRDKEILKLASPRSPRDKTKATAKDTSAVRFIDFDEKQPSISWAGISEREAARQVWLDKERDREMRRLSDLRKREEDHFKDISHRYTRAQAIFDEAEKKIKSHLQPLLDKAETIALQEKSREDQYKRSVQRKLTNIVTETAMSKGDLLADLILDDILVETVHELRRIEDEEKADAQAIVETDKEELETIALEEEKEPFRRRYKAMHHNFLEVARGDIRPKAEKELTPNGAKPIIFTSSSDTKRASPNMIRKKFQPRDKRALQANVNEGKRNICISDTMKASIFSYQKQYEKYLKRTIMDEHGSFNPWKIVEKISDEISEELIAAVEKEVEDLCDEYVEEVYKQEFLKNDSISTDVSVGDKTL